MKDLFENVNTDILSFLREIKLYKNYKCKHDGYHTWLLENYPEDCDNVKRKYKKKKLYTKVNRNNVYLISRH